MKYISVILMVLLAGCAAYQAAPSQGGLDSSDEGVYGVVHMKGHLTDSRFRIVRGEDRWRLEQKMPDGSYVDVTCEVECLLVDSTQEDVLRFLGDQPPPGMSAECIHNSSFAFCRVMGPEKDQRRYVLVALVTNPPIPLRLQRMPPGAP